MLNFAQMSRPEKINAVGQWCLDNADRLLSSTETTTEIAEEFGAPYNTIRGIQRNAFKGFTAPWQDGYDPGNVPKFSAPVNFAVVEDEDEDEDAEPVQELGAELAEAQVELDMENKADLAAMDEVKDEPFIPWDEFEHSLAEEALLNADYAGLEARIVSSMPQEDREKYGLVELDRTSTVVCVVTSGGEPLACTTGTFHDTPGLVEQGHARKFTAEEVEQAAKGLVAAEAAARQAKRKAEQRKVPGVEPKPRKPRGPNKNTSWLFEDGVFVQRFEDKPLCSCPTCGAVASSHRDVVGGFGVRLVNGQPRPQSLCKACRNAHKVKMYKVKKTV